jgi:hypothetical protein
MPPVNFIEIQSDPNRDPSIVSAIRLTLLADLESDGVPTGADRDPTTIRISD